MILKKDIDPFVDYLTQKINSSEHQAMTFRDYMNDCLYHPQFGYYMKEDDKIGKKGDFYTSSSIHSVFAEVFVDVTVDISNQCDTDIVFVEWGAGTGAFAKQFLDDLADRYPKEYQHAAYYIEEMSPYHRKVQSDLLQAHTDHVHWIATEAHQEFPIKKGIFYSNELLDAFPVHLIEKRDGKLVEIGITLEEGSLQETRLPLSTYKIPNYLEQQDIHLPEGHRLEVPIDATEWFQKHANHIEEGLWFTIDYGYTHEELIVPQRKNGTLQTYKKHQVNDLVTEQPGQKDITYHVHFDTLKAIGDTCGWTTLTFVQQHQFLLQAGILNQLQETPGTNPFDANFRKNRAIRQLIAPDGISSSFHVLTLGKGEFSQDFSSFQPFSIDQMITDHQSNK